MFIYTHPACLEHNPPPHADYAPRRLRSVIAALQKDKNLSWMEAAPATLEELYLVHTPYYVAEILKSIAPCETRSFDKETFAVSGTATALLHGSGAVIAATKAVVNKKTQKAFCVISPGGHHAEADMALGFCFFNHIALAALVAEKAGVNRVAVVDFDVHHGNGTQNIFWNYENRLFISLHEDSPLSGFAGEMGAHNNILNIPLARSSAGGAVLSAFIEKVIPKLENFKPDILFASAGFDMHRDDPLGSLSVETNDYYDIGRLLGAAANDLCQGRLVGVLEGGYNLDVLGDSVADFVAGVNNDAH